MLVHRIVLTVIKRSWIRWMVADVMVVAAVLLFEIPSSRYQNGMDTKMVIFGDQNRKIWARFHRLSNSVRGLFFSIQAMSDSIATHQPYPTLTLDDVFSRVVATLESLCQAGEIRASQRLCVHLGARYGQQAPLLVTRSSEDDPSDRFDLSVCLSLPLWEAVRPYAHFFVANITHEASMDTKLALSPSGTEASDESCIVRVFTVRERVSHETTQRPGKRQREEVESGQLAE